MNIDEARQLIRAKIIASPPIDPPVSKRPETLYHYTSAEGLLGIFSSNVLRASNALYLNDASELEYAKILIQGIIDETIAAGVPAPVREFLERSARDNFSILSLFQPHVCCFCGSGDLLSQWRAYADRGGGYAIGFEALPLARPADFLRAGISNADLMQVEYDRTVQNGQIKRSVELIGQALDECVKDQPAAEADLIPAACMVFRERLATFVFSYKHPAFSEEREWRLVSLEPRDDVGRFKLRPGNGFLAPYVELQLHWRVGPNNGKLPISEIVIGPTLHPELAKKSVELLLRRCGFNHVDIQSSEAPLRV